MSKIPRHRIENFSYSSTRHIRGVPVVKNINYEIVEGKTITGDAPKCFIRLYDKELNVGIDEIRRVEVPLFFFKRNKKRWPLYIVKTGHKWYPQESITEYLLNQLGEDFGLCMAKSSLRVIGGQLRFLSRYFLDDHDEELIHGADIFGGYIGDKDLIEQIEEEQMARDLFTLQFVKDAVAYNFPYQVEEIMNQFVKMLLFDALVGNNDRHFYNWGVKRSVTQRFQPYFAPVYDTARGLFWNDSEDKLILKSKSPQERDVYIKKYCKGSRPKIGWENEQNINHFKLIEKIVGSSFYISREEIITLFSRSTIERMFETIDSKFVYIMSPVRRDMIKHCIEYRYNKIWDIIC